MRVALLVLLLIAAPAAAQGVFVTSQPLATPATGDTRYALAAEPPTASPSFKDYIATGLGALTYTTAFEYTVEEDFTAEGDLEWRAYISCDRPTAFRPGNQNGQNDVPTVRAELLRGTTVLALAPKFETRTCMGPSSVWEAVFTFPVAGESWKAGELLRVNNVVWVVNGPATTQAQNVHVLGGAAHPSGLTGPGLPGGMPAMPAVVEQNITGGFQHTFETPQEGRYVLAFAAGDAMNITIHAEVQEGAAHLVLRDGAGAELLNGTWDTTRAYAADVQGAAGNWSFDVQYAGFVGSLQANVTAAAPPPATGNGTSPPGDGGGTSTQTVDGAPGNGTAAPDDAKDAPLPVVGALVAVAVALRRRL